MKFDPTWRQLILLAILLSSVVVANLVAPGVVGAITSMVSTVFGALFVNLREQPPPPKDAEVVQLFPPKEGE
jgi:hypothetical protein